MRYIDEAWKLAISRLPKTDAPPWFCLSSSKRSLGIKMIVKLYRLKPLTGTETFAGTAAAKK